jgi:hypothetical protein
MSPNEKEEYVQGLDIHFQKRLLVSIKLLLKENPVLPTSFNFNGECLIESLSREIREIKDYKKD